ncbi:MAG: TIGR01777 family protein [Ignavibacteriae bacterium]|nr:TIGR01777 family protein [Ignavibacteriota bacterium]
MNIIITGGTGFIGKVLVARLQKEQHRIVVLTRNPEAARTSIGNIVEFVQWDGKTVGAWAQHVDGADAVINLAGESIGARRWSERQKQRIIESRLIATKAVVTAISQAKKKPSVLINASAVGYYGNVESGDVTESHPKGSGFLADLAERWEAEARAAETHGARVVLLRFGVILEKDGGALQRMLIPFKLFAGGWLGSGRQWFPWIHRDDVVEAILFALKNQSLSGPVNVSAPEAVMMKEFCLALGKAMHRPCWAPVPSFVLKTALGEMASMLLDGQRMVPKKLLDAGYSFRYSELADALKAIVNR